MPSEHIFQRSADGRWYFRWVVPPRYHNLFEGRREIKHTLKTTNREAALSMAQRIMELIERAILVGMAHKKSDNGVAAFNDFIARLANGTLLYANVETEQDAKLLHEILGTNKAGQAAPSTASSESLSTVAERFLAEGETVERWTAKTKQEIGQSIKQLVEVLGDLPMTQLNRRNLSAFKDALLKLPAGRSKNPRWRGKSVKELLALEVPADQRMDMATVNKHLKRVSTFLRWGVKNGYLHTNPAEGQALPIKGKRDAGRQAWTDAEVAALLAAPVEHDWQKWMILLGLYTGARLTELAQLRVEDVKQVEGIPCLSITDEGTGQRLKTANSERIVPVHPKLVEAGLLAYAEAQRAKGHAQLFPELTLHRDGYGKAVSAWFGKWRLKLGIDKDFHSLRHGVAARLREADVSTEDIADLLGHSRGKTETARTYMKAATVQRLYAALSKLSYD